MSAPTSTAVVTTDRAARYGKQLASHLGRRSTSEWDDDAGTGSIVFSFGRCDLTAEDSGLRMVVEVSPDAEPDLQGDAGLDRLEDVVARHLVRFGTRDELVVDWHRSA